MSVTNAPYGPGYDEASSTALATQLAALLDSLHAQASYANDTYSPYTSAEVAAQWAAEATPPAIPPTAPEPPTADQEAKANEFKAWLGTVNTAVTELFAGDVGYQIRKWRHAAPHEL